MLKLALLRCSDIVNERRCSGFAELPEQVLQEIIQSDSIFLEENAKVKLLLLERVTVPQEALVMMIKEENNEFVRRACLQKYMTFEKVDFPFVCSLINDVNEVVRLEVLKSMQRISFPSAFKVQAIEKIIVAEGFDLDSAGALVLGLEDEWEAVRLEAVRVINYFGQEDSEFKQKGSEVILYCIGDESERVRRECLKTLVQWNWKIPLDLEVSDFLLPLVLDSVECVRNMILRLIQDSVIEHATVLVRLLRVLGKYVSAFPSEEDRIFSILKVISRGTRQLVLEAMPALLKVERFMVPQEQRIEEPMYRVVAFMLLITGLNDTKVWESLPKYLREKHVNYFLPSLLEDESMIVWREDEALERLGRIKDAEYLKQNVEFYEKLLPESCTKLKYFKASASGENTSRFWSDNSRRMTARILKQTVISGGILVSVELRDFTNESLENVHLLMLDNEFGMIKASPFDDNVVRVDHFDYYGTCLLEQREAWLGVGLWEHDKYITLSEELVRMI